MDDSIKCELLPTIPSIYCFHENFITEALNAFETAFFKRLQLKPPLIEFLCVSVSSSFRHIATTVEANLKVLIQKAHNSPFE